MANSNSIQRGKNVIDLTNQRFGRLVATTYAGRTNNGGSRWLCLCDCGNEHTTTTHALRNGDTKSCGCLHRDATVERSRTHGKHDSPEYKAWADMISRCTNINMECYKHYGGRGISVCHAWKASFAAFYADVGPRPSALYSLDRIDNDGNYEPGNVRWATRQQQRRNARNTRFIDFNGETLCIQDWAARLGMSHQGLRNRLNKWSVEKALTTPVIECGKRISQAKCGHPRHLPNGTTASEIPS